jgi:hypothetical protein
MTVNIAAPVASLDAIIAPPVAGGTISIHSRDALGNWGGFTTIVLNVVGAGPTISAVSASKNPNNGALPLNASQPVVRVTATMTGGSTITAAEGFIDTVGANGTGFQFVPSDGAWNSATETAFGDIPLATVNLLSAGNHTIFVHGKDAAGNWGTWNPLPSVVGKVILLIDRAVPTFTSITLTPATINVGGAMALTVNGSTDPLVAGLASGVAGGEYWIGTTDIAAGTGTSFTGLTSSVDTSALAGGTHTVRARIRDAAGNWSTVVRTATLNVIQAVNDIRTIAANGSATQTNDTNTAARVLANDQPIGVAGRTAALASAPVRTSGAGAGTITVTCPGSLGTAAAPAISGNTVCTNGGYRVILNGLGANNAARLASKLGTYQFTYTETLNGVTTPPATVTITVN